MAIAIAGLLVMIGLIVAGNTIGNAIQIAADAIIQQMKDELEEFLFSQEETD